jgi:predicted CopG family antitoxin
MRDNTGSTHWPKSGARIRPDIYEKIKELAHEARTSFNMVLNELLEEGLLEREKDVTT